MNFLKIAFIAAVFLTACVDQEAPTEQPSQQNQIAFFNHLYVVVDDELAAAIEDSEVLAKFGALDIRSVETGNGEAWTGRYLYGRQTYFEVFTQNDFDKDMRPSIGHIGLAVSSDIEGSIFELSERLKKKNIDIVENMRTKVAENGEDENWFYQIRADINYQDPSLVAWAMEYDPIFMDRNKEEAESSDNLISRERYIDDTYLSRQMRDVTAIKAGIKHEDFKNERPLLEAAGYDISEFDGGVLLKGQDTELTFEFVDHSAIGLRSISFDLNQPVVDVSEHNIGTTKLVIGPGNKAVWKFKD